MIWTGVLRALGAARSTDPSNAGGRLDSPHWLRGRWGCQTPLRGELPFQILDDAVEQPAAVLLREDEVVHLDARLLVGEDRLGQEANPSVWQHRRVVHGHERGV